MATYPTGSDIYRRLPNGTVVDRPTVQMIVADAISRLDECHSSGAGTAPITDRTVGIVWRYALARAQKQHYMQGEAYIETPAIDSEIAAAEADILAYCLRIAQQEAEDSGDTDDVGQPSGVMHVGESPF